MRLKTKLSALSAIGIALTLVVGFIGYHGIGEVTGTTTELKTSAQMIRYQMMADMMHDALRGDVLAAMQAKNDDDKKEVQTDLADHAGTFRENVAKNLELKSSPSIRSALTDVGPALESYIKSAETIVGAAATDKAKAEELWPAFKEAFSILEDRMEQLSDLMEKDAQAREESAQKTTRVATTAMLVAAAFALIAMAFVTTIIARSITIPVQRMVHRVTDIAQGEGDLTQRIEADSNDELGDLGREFNLFMEKLQTMISRVQKTAARLATASEQISSSTDQISGDAQQQAASLEETSASLRQITEIVKHNADNATVASKIASESRTSADKGGQTVSSATLAMGEISVASKRVAEIITTIDEIAFQTNLLSLNAAVEAARAGEQGRGFAVVATEVRNLATRSGSAAKQIRELIQDSVAKVDTGSSLIHESGENLGGLLKSVNKVNDIIGEIAAASQEQANSIEQVGVAVRTMEQVTNRNNEQTVELAELARALASQATSLNELVGGFHVGVHDSDAE